MGMYIDGALADIDVAASRRRRPRTRCRCRHLTDCPSQGVCSVDGVSIALPPPAPVVDDAGPPVVDGLPPPAVTGSHDPRRVLQIGVLGGSQRPAVGPIDDDTAFEVGFPGAGELTSAATPGSASS